jgi:hypothetical protein
VATSRRCGSTRAETCPGRSTTSGLRPPCASSTGQGRLVGRAAGARPWDSPKNASLSRPY